MKNLNRNVTYSNVTRTNQVVTVQENPKIQQLNDRRDINKIVIITNIYTSTLKNSPQIKKSFFELFPSKRLLFAFRNSQNNLHLEFDNEQNAKEVIGKWDPTFLGHPATQNTKHCLLIEEIDESFSETDITGELESSYNIPKQDFEVRRFKTKEDKELKTVEIDFREAGVKPCNQDPSYKQRSNRLYPPQNAEEIWTQLPGTIAATLEQRHGRENLAVGN